MEEEVRGYFDDTQDAQVYIKALELACRDLQAAKKFCPRYHGLYRCSDDNRLCPAHGREWTCWAQAYVKKALEAQREGRPE